MQFLLSRISEKIKANKLLGGVYGVNALLAFHVCLLVYINSSFLSQFFSESQVSALYVLGSLLTLLLLVNISKILQKLGNYKMISYLIVAEIAATFGLAFSVSPFLIAIYFIIYLVSIPTILFGFDLLLESVTKDESKTGEIRTTYITIGNIIIILCTLLVSWILTDGDYYKIYLVSLLFLIPLYFVMRKQFSRFSDGHAPHIKIKETVLSYLKNKDLYNVFTVHLSLQIFYAYMVIYMPIYLSRFIGFSWSEIGLIFTLMLLPFIFIEIPVGWLADKKWGEKEMMTVGCAIMAIFTVVISFITVKSFILWAVVLFMTRIGAALVEATTDSYFFKKVNKNDTDTIGFYRLSGPASLIIAPVVATLSLSFLSYSHIFIVLAGIVLFGCHYSLALNDTR